MRTRVKICGITRTEDVDLAVNAGVDAIGLVFSIKVLALLRINKRQILAWQFRRLFPVWLYLKMLMNNWLSRC